MSDPARVLCVDDHPVVRAGLRALIGMHPMLSVVAEADDEVSTRRAVVEKTPDLIVMDVRLGLHDGLALTAALVRETPSLRVVVLSSYAGDEEVHRAFDAGARAYVLKEFAAEEIVAALDQVRKGHTYVSREIANRLTYSGPRVHLTPAESSVLGRLSQGRADHEIAEESGLNQNEVARCLARLSTKFDRKDRISLVRIATMRGFLPRDASHLDPEMTQFASGRASRGKLAAWQLKRAQEYLTSHIDENLPLAAVAASVKLSSFHFARAFKQTTGVAPHAWLTASRMTRAVELMREYPNMSLTEVALSVGYQSQAAFGTAFRHFYGQSPGKWRREYLADPSLS